MAETTLWDQTELWRLLSEREGDLAEQVRTTLKVNLPTISQVLSSGATAAKDFTLHDEGHGRRVAERMPQLVPAEVLSELSPYELAFLLLSAYLHDIGMVPTQRKVSTHYEYLLTGEASLLLPKELDEFQAYLTDLTPPVEAPLTSGPPTARQLRQAGKLTAYYCRHRHADWSADWIRANLADQKLGTYATWIEDLISLCKSHHWDYDELRSGRLDTRLIGGRKTQVVNLRYLACVLRVADILEFDPERTPAIILEHRDVDAGSVVYWQKDHYPSIDRMNENLLFSARPPNAVLHRALETMAEDIDAELQLCARLSREEPFDRYQGKQLPHRWDYPSHVVQDIKPLDDSYVYIDGTFQPDTNRLLELLSGTRLYHTPLAAVRELLQNAFDAVRQQVAYARKTVPNPSSETTRDRLEELHWVELRLSRGGDALWLTCTDTGVGMGRQQIERRLLVSGRSADADLLKLRRQSRARGFDFARSGEFGIGVLSYFMIADRVEITTRRSQAAGDAEPHGWEFSTDGPNSFGELRPRSDLQQPGTSVRLRLLPTVVGADVEAWFAKLVRYIRQTFRMLPCRLLVTMAQGPEGAEQSHGWPHGWMTTIEELAAKLEAATEWAITELTRYGHDPVGDLYDLSRLGEAPRGIDFRSSLRWHIEQGVVPDREGLTAGSYRLCIPYFELPDGPSLAATTLTDSAQAAPIAFLADANVEINWHGAAIQAQFTDDDWRAPGVVEVDLRSSDFGVVDVNRDSVNLSDLALERLGWIRKRLVECRRAFAGATSGSSWFLLNSVVATASIPGRLEGMYWPTLPNRQGWHRLGALVAIGPAPPPTVGELTWGGRKVDVLAEVLLVGGQISRPGDPWSEEEIEPPSRQEELPSISVPVKAARPDYVVPALLNPGRLGGTPEMALYAVTDPDAESPGLATALGWACRFPPEWADVLYVELEGRGRAWGPGRPIVWNMDHLLVRSATVDGTAWANAQRAYYRRGLFEEDPVVDLDALMSSQAFAAAWLSKFQTGFFRHPWEGLEPSVREAIWRKAFNLGPTTPLAGRRMILVEPRSTRALTPESGELAGLRLDELPKPSEHWWLGVVRTRGRPERGGSGSAP
jgi:hypothetical protein